MTIRIAALASGRGSNLQAVIDAIAAGTLDAGIVGVFSDKPDAAALQRVPEALRWSRQPKTFASRDAFDAALGDAVAASEPDWIICVGYMRILGEAFVQRFRGRLLNIHPSLLPKYKGLHTHARALEAGDAEHGASVHFVTAELDAGAVIAQARVLSVEHPLLLQVLRLAAAGRIAERDGQAMLDGQPLFTPLPLEFASR